MIDPSLEPWQRELMNQWTKEYIGLMRKIQPLIVNCDPISIYAAAKILEKGSMEAIRRDPRLKDVNYVESAFAMVDKMADEWAREVFEQDD